VKSQDTHDFEHRIEGRPVSAAKRAIEGCPADIRLSGNLNHATSNHSEIDCTANATEIICRKSRSKGLLHFTRHRNYRNSAPRRGSDPPPASTLDSETDRFAGAPLAINLVPMARFWTNARSSESVAAAHEKNLNPRQLTAGDSQTFGIRSYAEREAVAGTYSDP
jgi:hypothetical protein